MTIVTSVHNSAIKAIRQLADRKHRQAEGLFVAEGGKVLARARDEGWEPVTVLSLTAVEPWGEARLIRVDEKVMASVSAQRNPPPVLAVFRQRWQRSVSPRGVWVALEEMRDPGNLGTIIRTADAVGASGVVLAGHSCDPWGPDCVRATMGSIFGLPLVRLAHPDFLDLCRSWPGEVVGTHLEATADYRRTYRPPTLLVMGSESKGLSADAAAACSALVRIPMPGRAESLNVAVATALMLYETIRD